MRRALLVPTALILILATACKSDQSVGSLVDEDSGNPDGDTNDGGGNIPGEPIADAGDDTTVAPLADVSLDGSESYDPGGASIDQYRWEMKTRPPASSAELTNTKTAWPSFRADVAGSYEISLSVQNTDGVWDSTPDSVLIEARPQVGFYVELSWDTPGVDLDLHLLQGNASVWDATGDCYWCNGTPDWGNSGTLDDPSLDEDNRAGDGPETITIEAPANGQYRVAVHYYGEDGLEGECWDDSCPSTVATINFYNNGTLTHTVSKPLTTVLKLWDAGTVDWPSGTFTNGGGISTVSIDGACP